MKVFRPGDVKNRSSHLLLLYSFEKFMLLCGRDLKKNNM